MATQTTNIGLSKPAYSDTADIAVINSNMDTIDSTVNNIEKGIAIVSDGNTHSAIAKGEYVYVRDHSTLAEGLYVASSAISANATLTTSNLTSKSKGIGGEVATLNDKITYKELDGISSQSALDTALTNWLLNMSTVSKDMLTFSPSASFGYFISGERYYVEISKSLSTTYSTAIITRNSSTDLIVAGKQSSGWRYDSISGRFGNCRMFSFAVNGNSSKTLTLPNVFRGVMVSSSAFSTDCGVFSITTTSGGVSGSNKMVGGSDVSFDTSVTSKITISVTNYTQFFLIHSDPEFITQ